MYTLVKKSKPTTPTVKAPRTRPTEAARALRNARARAKRAKASWIKHVHRLMGGPQPIDVEAVRAYRLDVEARIRALRPSLPARPAYHSAHPAVQAFMAWTEVLDALPALEGAIGRLEVALASGEGIAKALVEVADAVKVSEEARTEVESYYARIARDWVRSMAQPSSSFPFRHFCQAVADRASERVVDALEACERPNR